MADFAPVGAQEQREVSESERKQEAKHLRKCKGALMTRKKKSNN